MQLISFIIPCYRSAQTIGGVVAEIREKMNTLEEYDHEIILVNDCSPDDTYAVIREMASGDARITAIDFARNFGQHSALMAGLRQSKGDIVICLDDDGQTPASEADRLLEALEQGADVAYARYSHKKHSLFRNFGSYVNEKMAEFMLDKPKTLYVSSYFAAKRFIVNDMIRYENSYPYVIGLVLRTTRNIVNVDINHRNREVGQSGYSLKKLLGLWMNGFTSFSVKPLRIATVLGVIAALAGFIYGIVIVIQRFVLPGRVLGFASLAAILVFFGGMIMIMLGLIGEYVGRIYISMNNSPQYVIREIVKKEENTRADE
ncbi:MAG: glycosyltransferase family 2 protein [Lachnospiraceae bacterium]|nr:glycosyltransferase family 2 protein [Lachnospiraceae bacterium]